MDQEDTRNDWQGSTGTKEQPVRNNTITKMKNTLEGINHRITEAEEQINEMQDRLVEITFGEQVKENK